MLGKVVKLYDNAKENKYSGKQEVTAIVETQGDRNSMRVEVGAFAVGDPIVWHLNQHYNEQEKTFKQWISVAKV